MGLDMYLHARRSFDPASPETTAILAAANVTLDELEKLAANDPMEHETDVYLSHWDFMKERTEGLKEYERAEAVFVAAGVLPFATKESGGGALSYKDGNVSVAITCAYWRKANAIHAWFVHNCQNDVDECEENDVSREHLEQLRSVCQEVLDDTSKAGALLPPQAGFFFGSTDIDEWYLEDLKLTIDQIDHCLKIADDLGDVQFSYRSSW